MIAHLADAAAIAGVIILATLALLRLTRGRLRPAVYGLSLRRGDGSADWHAYLASESKEIDDDLAGWGHEMLWEFPDGAGDLKGVCGGCAGVVTITAVEGGTDIDYSWPISNPDQLEFLPCAQGR